MKDLFIGIDPSVNSTGICIHEYDDKKLIKENFYIVLPSYKMTKSKMKENDKYDYFDYIPYEAIELKEFNEDNHKHEYQKTINLINLIDTVYDTIKSKFRMCNHITILMEGVSYGSSLRTKSVYDLAGLNYMVRMKLIKKDNINLIIATPKEIKKWVTGNGNAKKEQIEALFKISHKDFTIKKLDDIADAYYMARYARQIYLGNI